MKPGLLKIVFVPVLAVFVGAGAYLLFKSSDLRGQAPQVIPFTATMEDYHQSTAMGSPQQRVEYYTLARRSDGSQVAVHRRKAPDGSWNNARIIIDLSKGERITVDDLTQSITTYPLSPATIKGYRALQTYCNGTGGKASSVLGYKTVQTAGTGKVPPGQQVEHDTWWAPTLNCFALKNTWTWTNPGAESPADSRTLQAVTIVPGEPSSSLFSIPSNYTERSPGEVMSQFAQRFNKQVDPRTDQLLDGVYQKAHSTPH
ncbi:MAG: hypothetical protein ACRD06_07905 [Terriglobia bacterium]